MGSGTFPGSTPISNRRFQTKLINNFCRPTITSTSEDYTGATGIEIIYGYDICPDGKGRLCSATTTAAVSNYEYNTLGLQKKETKTISSVNYMTQTSYDRLVQ